jgi:hypothetical protein
MYPEDRVLVGVINRKRDLTTAQNDRWYRIPQARMPRTVNAEYLAFFLSGAFGPQNGAIHYYAERRGLELLRRRDLLPREAGHKRADEVYYKVSLGDLLHKHPPITNPSRRPISFIYTTWDRFVHANVIRDLYSDNDYYVDRIYHALRDSGVQAERSWDAEQRTTGSPAHLRILCDGGYVTASPGGMHGAVFMDSTQNDDATLNVIREAIAKQGGPVTLNIPLEGR